MPASERDYRKWLGVVDTHFPKMKIEVVPYRPEWPAAFEAEEKAILGLSLPGVINIHHIGSTAVEGLSAKPIIDIMIEAQSLEELDQNKKRIESLGYEAMGAFGIVGRRYYRKGVDDRTHQIHAFQISDPNLCRHLAFRNYLREYPEIRKEYAALKERVASECDHDINEYCDGKNDFIQLHEAKALDWINGKPTLANF